MRSLKLIFLFPFILMTCSNSWGMEPRTLCEEISIIRDGRSSSNTKLGKLLKAILFPKSVLRLKGIDRIKGAEGRLGPNELHVFVNLVKKEDFQNASVAKVEARGLKRIKKLIKGNELYKTLLEQESLEDCLSEIDRNKSGFLTLVALIESLNDKLPFAEIKTRIDTHNYTIKNIKNLKRSNWVIHEEFYLEDFLKVMSGNPTDIIIIGHAYENGSIVDAEGKLLPTSIFSNAPTSLQSLLIFSCHSLKVIETYQLNSLTDKGRFFFHFPMLKDSFSVTFGDATPLLGIKSLISYGRKITATRLPLVNEKNCKLVFSANSQNGRLLVYLNNRFLSSLTSSEIPFYCDLASERNVVTLVQMNKRNDVGHGDLPDNVIIHADGSRSELEFKHSYKNGTYLSSKTYPKEK